MRQEKRKPEVIPASGWLTVQEAADYLKCAVITLNIDRCTKKYGIPYYRLGRRIRYAVDDLDAYMRSHRVK